MSESVLITGATAGIGYEFAELFAAEGCSLALVARNAKRLAERQEFLQKKYGVRVETVAKDLAQPTAAAEIFEELIRRKFDVSVLVNNAGFGTYGDFFNAELEQDLAMVQVNVAAVLQLTKLFLKPMVEKRRGRVLNVASLASFLPGPRMAIYSATKSFLQSFSCALSLELAGTGVTATVLCPGGTETEFHRRAGMKGIDGSQTLSAKRVAEIGYAAMMRGEPIVVAGVKNRVFATLFRAAPVMWSANFALKVNKGAGL